MIGVHQQNGMEISVTHMTQNWSLQAALFYVVLRLGHSLGQFRQRHTDVCHNGPRTLMQRADGVIGIMAHRP